MKRIAGEVWGDCNGRDVTSHKFGDGRVFWGMTLREILVGDGIAPDFEYVSDASEGGVFLNFITGRRVTRKSISSRTATAARRRSIAPFVSRGVRLKSGILSPGR